MYSGQLAEQRRKSIAYYLGKPYGNEIEGRSQVVTTEVRDAIEGQLPALLEIFAASDEIVKFEAENANDEAEAQQKTDYANYVFWRQNNGFLTLYCGIKDALMVKNCFTKVYWENYEENTKETYEGLTDDEFMFLMQDEEVELIEHTETQAPAPPQQPGQPPQPPMMLHDATFRRTKKNGKICIDSIPPEEIKVSKDCGNDITKARFVQHSCKKSISTLREMGFKVDDDITDDSAPEWNIERQERKSKIEDGTQDDSGIGPSREVWVDESEYRVDFDGDGITELRKIITVGKNLLSNEEVDSGSILTGTPKVMPHELFGFSTSDDVMDIQEQKTAVTRNLLDNAYFQNNGRYEALDGMVNMDDLLTNRPGGIVRVKTLGAVKRIDSPLLGAPAYSLLEYLDKVKDQRIGVSPADFAADPNALNAKAHVAEIAQSSSMQRTTLIARILAETWIKPIFEKVIELAAKHDTKSTVVKLRDKYIPVNPREWTTKFNTIITVGLGTGSQQAIQNNIMGMFQIYQGMAATGLSGRVVTEQNAYNLLMELAKVTFPRKAELFATDPSQLPPPQPQPDPKTQLGYAKLQVGAQQKDKQLQANVAMHQQDLQHEAGMQATNFVGQASIKGIDVASQTNLQAAQQGHDRRTQSQDQAHQRASDTQQHLHEHAQGRMQSQDQEKQAAQQAEQEASDAKAQKEQDASDKQDQDREDLKGLIQQIAQGQQQQAEQNQKILEVIGQALNKPDEQGAQQTELLKQIASKKSKRTGKAIRDEKGNLQGFDVTEE